MFYDISQIKLRGLFLQPGNETFISKVIEMFDLFVNAISATNNILFLERIILPVVKRVFDAGNTAYPPDEVIHTHFKDTLRNHSITLNWLRENEKTACSKSCYAEAKVPLSSTRPLYKAPKTQEEKENQVFFNDQWFSLATRVYNQYDPSHDLGSYSNENLRINIHLLLGFNKLVNEFMHTLAEIILDFEAVYSKQERFDRTPVQVGVKRSGSASTTTSSSQVLLEGDIGYGFQEALLGNGLRLKGQYMADWIMTGIFFEQGIVQTPPDMLKTPMHESPEKDFTAKVVYLNFKPDSLSEPVPMWSYINNILRSFAQYQASHSGEHAESLYRSFQVNISLLQQYAEEFSVAVTTYQLKRKHAHGLSSVLNELAPMEVTSFVPDPPRTDLTFGFRTP